MIEEVLEYAEGRRDCVIHGDVERGLSAARGRGGLGGISNEGSDEW